MDLNTITERVRTLASSHGGKVGSKIKFAFEDGSYILLDDSVTPPTVSNDDGDAACTVRLSQENFVKLLDGEMNAMGAYMMGRLKIDGDMGIAMKLANLF